MDGLKLTVCILQKHIYLERFSSVCCFKYRTTHFQTQGLRLLLHSLIESSGATSPKTKSPPSLWPWRGRCVSVRTTWTESTWWATPSLPRMQASRYLSSVPVIQASSAAKYSTASRTTTTSSTSKSKVGSELEQERAIRNTLARKSECTFISRVGLPLPCHHGPLHADI